MNLTDIIALAKSGYSVADVKELMELGTKAETTTETENEQVEESHTAKQEDVKNTTVNVEDDAVLDYKKMYEELAQKTAELETQLKQVQALNTRKTVGTESQEDFATSFGDFAREFM